MTPQQTQLVADRDMLSDVFDAAHRAYKKGQFVYSSDGGATEILRAAQDGIHKAQREVKNVAQSRPTAKKASHPIRKAGTPWSNMD